VFSDSSFKQREGMVTRSRGAMRPSLASFWTLSIMRGRREDRVHAAPMVRVQQKSTRQNHRYEPNNRPSLRNGFTAYTRSPR
jgi:hypothetical protein